MKVGKGKERLGAFPYVIGGLAYVPLFGVLFGIIALIWGLATTRTGGRTLAFMGAGGIAFTAVVYSGLFYFGFAYRGGVFDELRTDLARSTITSLVQAIEFHKTQNGTYPESLQSLQRSLTEDSIVFVFDPTDVGLDAQPRYFFYQLVRTDHYYLLGVGADGEPVTSDDIHPNITVGPDSRVGLLIRTR